MLVPAPAAITPTAILCDLQSFCLFPCAKTFRSSASGYRHGALPKPLRSREPLSAWAVQGPPLHLPQFGSSCHEIRARRQARRRDPARLQAHPTRKTSDWESLANPEGPPVLSETSALLATGCSSERSN